MDNHQDWAMNIHNKIVLFKFLDRFFLCYKGYTPIEIIDRMVNKGGCLINLIDLID